MPAPLPIRDDRSPQELRALARKERDGRVGARLHALAHALDGRSRTEAARLAGMDRQTLRSIGAPTPVDGCGATTSAASTACATGRSRDGRSG